MKEMNICDMQNTIGGASIGGALINALNSLIKNIYSMGQGVGGALRRIVSKKSCSCS